MEILGKKIISGVVKDAIWMGRCKSERCKQMKTINDDDSQKRSDLSVATPSAGEKETIWRQTTTTTQGVCVD